MSLPVPPKHHVFRATVPYGASSSAAPSVQSWSSTQQASTKYSTPIFHGLEAQAMRQGTHRSVSSSFLPPPLPTTVAVPHQSYKMAKRQTVTPGFEPGTSDTAAAFADSVTAYYGSLSGGQTHEFALNAVQAPTAEVTGSRYIDSSPAAAAAAAASLYQAQQQSAARRSVSARTSAQTFSQRSSPLNSGRHHISTTTTTTTGPTLFQQQQQQQTLQHAQSAASSQRTQYVDMRERVTHVTHHTGEERVLAEYIIEHEVKVPKKTIREDVIERTYVVPERVIVEEIVEEDARFLEKIVEVAHPVIQEKIVEVPEYEYVEKIVEVPQKVIQEKFREVPRISVQERIVEVPRIVQQDKVVQVPMYEYHDVIIEKNVEVPEIREELVIKEVPVPQYVERLVPEERVVEVQEDVARKLPVPVESLTELQLVLPKVRTIRTALDVPVYVPRFVEIPVAAEFCAEEFVDCAERCGEEVSRLMMRTAVEPISLTALENTAAMVQSQQFEETFARQDFIANFVHWWKINQLSIDEVSLRSVCRTVEETTGAVVTEALSLVKPTAKFVSQHIASAPLATTEVIQVSSARDVGLENAIITNEIDTQSVKTDKVEEPSIEEGEYGHTSGKMSSLLRIAMPPLGAPRESIDSLSSAREMASRIRQSHTAVYSSNPNSRSNSASSIPKQLATSSPAPIFPIMRGMETAEVSGPLTTAFESLGEEPDDVAGSQQEIENATEE
eukprot:Gregarina_sp_Poly_1__3785@NODE_2123_length_2636_cov_286_066952_g1355_i1_p1_GENE_NODE_2123_length_2636_cov_286_066952_g1355_i1NODE_2123_length_2636_cov_286_066952_g1355_i1_p1_ORF_typecomplete_len727_score120_72IMCp/PF12314_8/7_4e02IMCp/PF12314_8/1_9e14IMCp/PF12314_8/0_2IMCp/PF12314_8/8e02EZH2_N/PF18601_1/5e03EZH2_N/PF18601_1/0_073FAM163/PF15069_6/6_3e02FAM163/PF15069_6/0_68Nucleoporin_FG/PF13634_6/1_8_NODE_2123_length_2636_cov_286_066952_g1355_i11702350